MMTSKERWLAAIKMKPVDRLPFWPKIFPAYKLTQTDFFKKMSILEIHQWIGSDRHDFVPPSFKEVRKNTSLEQKKDKTVSVTKYHTKYGTMETVHHYDEASDSWHPTSMAVKSVEDIRRLTEWYRDCAIEYDPKSTEDAICIMKEAGENSILGTVIGESPLMDFVEWFAGVENAHYFLTDYEDEVNELFNAMHSLLLKKTEMAVGKSPAELLYMIENTSTTLISPSQFQKYCYKHLLEYGNIVKAAGRLQVLHMCGHLKALLPTIAQLPAIALEAFTSPTLGNTTLLDGRSACPNKCLIGGTNAILWSATAKEIISQLENDLDALPHHRGLVITSAGVMPPLSRPETIKEVCDWVKRYRVKL